MWHGKIAIAKSFIPITAKQFCNILRFIMFIDIESYFISFMWYYKYILTTLKIDWYPSQWICNCNMALKWIVHWYIDYSLPSLWLQRDCCHWSWVWRRQNGCFWITDFFWSVVCFCVPILMLCILLVKYSIRAFTWLRQEHS